MAVLKDKDRLRGLTCLQRAQGDIAGKAPPALPGIARSPCAPNLALCTRFCLILDELPGSDAGKGLPAIPVKAQRSQAGSHS
jgi:hypothetical protein